MLSPCFYMQFFVPSSFALILLGKTDLVALQLLSSWCHVAVTVLYLFLMVLWVGL